MKKVLLLIGLAISVFFCDVILRFLTGNGFIALWGSIALPSFVAGIILHLLVVGTERERFVIWMAVTVLASKMILIFMIDVPDYFGILLIVFFYFFGSYLFTFLGRKISEGGRR
jgi:hypothetical protein